MPRLSKPITRADIRSTMRAIPVGASRSFAAIEIGDIQTLRVAAYKLNAIDNANYKITTPDHGVTITITNQSI